jgi:hypothetical protein
VRYSILFLLVLLVPGEAHSARTDGLDNSPAYTKKAGCDDSRIRSSPAMLRALRAIKARNGGRPPELVSCYRSQANQDQILRRNGCKPFGSKNCSGTVARRSGHTYGIAADMQLSASGQAVCQQLDQVRTEVLGGKGGVGGYGGNLGHLELSDKRCSWNICGRVLRGGCEGGYKSAVVDAYRCESMAEAR